MELPGWLAPIIIVGSFAGLGVPMFLAWLRQRAFDAQYRAPPGPLPIKALVRGPDGAQVNLELFASCWRAAFEAIAKGDQPWPRSTLTRELGGGSKVQVHARKKWLGASGRFERADVRCRSATKDTLVCEIAKGDLIDVPRSRVAPESGVREAGDVGTLIAVGALVGGELVGGVLHIGPDFDSLCHELIHRCEQVLEIVTDNEHKTWQARGLHQADAAYRRWLATGVS